MNLSQNKVSIVFSPDNNYAKYLCVTLQSLVVHASAERLYSITILNDDLTDGNRYFIEQILTGRRNVEYRFVNIRELLSSEESSAFYKSRTDHISDACYFRFFIPQIIENESKVLYLDSDLVIKSDVAALYDVELGDHWIAGTRDLGIESWVELKKYISSRLGIENGRYVNSGVLLMNLDEFRSRNLTKACLDKLVELQTPMCHDQDVLNCVCKDHILYLPYNWNVLWNLKNDGGYLSTLISEKEYDEFLDQTRTPDIIHFATSVKPWKRPDLILADQFWLYARQTPCYEAILFANLETSSGSRADDQSLTLGEIVNYGKHKRRYYRYKLLAVVAPSSRLRKAYRDKKRQLKGQLRATRAILKERKFSLH